MEKLTLEELKKTETQILDYVASVCEENNLKYFLAYGTLLGAVRHKGFIPWDDDIDIFMPRSDYMKFIEIAGSDKNGKYRCFSVFGEDGYYYPFIKVSDNATFVDLKCINLKKIEGLGACIDIFPLDDFNGKKSLKRKAKILFYKYLLASNLKFAKSGSAIRNLPKRIIYSFYKNKDPKKYSYKLETLPAKYHKKTGKLFVAMTGEEFDLSWFGDGAPLEFEGKTYNCPSDSDAVLKSLFGDYMTLPPEEERVSHGNDIYRI